MDGYKTLQDLTKFNNWTQSYRYKTLKLEKAGQYYLFKQASDDLTKKLLINEIHWREFFTTVEIRDVVNTEIVEQGDDYLLFKWVEANYLARRSKAGVKGLGENIDRFVDLLIAVRQAARNYSPTINDAEATRINNRYDALSEYTDERLKPLLSAGWIDSKKVQAIQSLYAKYLPFAEVGYQHGDFTPWHIFVQGNKWIIYDAEHASSLRSGYIDLIHTYCRLYCVCKSPELAQRMLKRFLQKSGEDEGDFKQKTISAFVKRAVGNLIDSYNDRKTADFRRQANDLLDKVLKDDLNALFS